MKTEAHREQQRQTSVWRFPFLPLITGAVQECLAITFNLAIQIISWQCLQRTTKSFAGFPSTPVLSPQLGLSFLESQIFKTIEVFVLFLKKQLLLNFNKPPLYFLSLTWIGHMYSWITQAVPAYSRAKVPPGLNNSPSKSLLSTFSKWRYLHSIDMEAKHRSQGSEIVLMWHKNSVQALQCLDTEYINISLCFHISREQENADKERMGIKSTMHFTSNADHFKTDFPQSKTGLSQAVIFTKVIKNSFRLRSCRVIQDCF